MQDYVITDVMLGEVLAHITAFNAESALYKYDQENCGGILYGNRPVPLGDSAMYGEFWKEVPVAELNGMSKYVHMYTRLYVCSPVHCQRLLMA